MLGCEMRFVLYFIRVGNIVCRVTGKKWVEDFREQREVFGCKGNEGTGN
jgi:hypothetical protein